MTEPTVITLGCRINAVESEVMRRHAAHAGLKDAVIINTCAVTGEAVRQARQTIRRLRRDRPGAQIIVTGCAAQIEPEAFAAMPEVDRVIGNAEKLGAATFAGLSLATSPRVQVDDIMSVRDTAAHLIQGFGNRVRAFVQVQNGCDHRCTFCIIPFGRGPSRSVPAGDVVAQVRRLVESGTPEVVLTGVDLTSYGADLPGGMTLGRLVRQTLRLVPELQRLRLSSIDQVEVDPDLMDAIADEPRLMPHLHLSMQAGDDLILKRMKRRHSRAKAVAFCAQVRRLRQDVVFGADLIAGFPSETDDMFKRSLDMIGDCDLTFLHVFPFSPRKGTPAARMPQLPRPLVKDRARQLRERGTQAVESYLDRQVGCQVEVLVENGGTGRTPQFVEMRVPGPLAGRIVSAHVVAHANGQLIGEVAA